MPTPILTPVSYATLSAMLTPAIFMTANGSLIISTSNRLSRILDRIRGLNDLADRLDRGATELDYPELRRIEAEEEIRNLVWRSDVVRYALTYLYVAFSAFVATSLTLALDVWLANRLPALPTLLAIAGVTLLLLASLNLTREARRALESNRREVKFYQDLRVRRHTDLG